MTNYQPDIIITNKDGEKFSVKANQGKFTIDIDYYGTHFRGENCIVHTISPGKYGDKDTIRIEFLPDSTSIDRKNVEEVKLDSNIEETMDNCI